MKRVLITGSNGLLGQNLVKLLQFDDRYEVLALSRSPNVIPDTRGFSFLQCNLTNQVKVNEALNNFLPDVIIHAAAMTQVDPCELDPELCHEINTIASQNLAEWAEQHKAHFIFTSTDFVFDGLHGPYHEDDTPSPVSVYGESKFKAEKVVTSLTVPWAIVRTILVYGLTPAMSRSNLVLWVKNSLENAKAIQVVNDQFRMPTLVDDLAWSIGEIMHHRHQGIFHISGPDYGSVYDFAIWAAKYFNLDESLISPIPSTVLNQPGKRPPKTGFDLVKAKKILGYKPKSFTEGLSVVQNLLDKK